MDLSRKNVIIGLSFLAILTFFGLTYLIRPIVDPDFFWHLKTGEWLWLERSWPIPDPFSFTSPGVLNLRQLFIVKGYWLCQLLYFLFYSAFGWFGVVVIRFMLFSALVYVLWTGRRGDLPVWTGLGLVFLISLLAMFPVDRPQFFSFVFFAGFYLYLDRCFAEHRFVKKGHILLASGLMLVWGNFHGGVMLGQGLLILAGGCAGISFLFNRGTRTPIDYRGLRVFILACLLASVCNPGILTRPLHVLHVVGGSLNLMSSVNEEYASVFDLWKNHQFTLLIPYATFFGFGLWGLVRGLRTQPLFAILVLVGTTVYAAINLRFHPFFMAAVLPVAARGVELTSLRWIFRGLAVAAVLFFGIYFTRLETGNWGKVRAAGWVSNQDYPVAVADNLQQRSLEGRLFNLYRWGGYLLWKLGPQQQVFIDGRGFDSAVLRDALTAELVSFGGSGPPLWKRIFDKYQIDSAILPIIENGSPYGLTVALYADPAWYLAYSSGNATLFLKR